MTASTETTQEIDYVTCNTLEIRLPVVAERHRPQKTSVWRRLTRRWDDVWPPLVGCFLGFSGAVGLWLVFLIAWLDQH